MTLSDKCSVGGIEIFNSFPPFSHPFFEFFSRVWKVNFRNSFFFATQLWNLVSRGANSRDRQTVKQTDRHTRIYTDAACVCVYTYA